MPDKEELEQFLDAYEISELEKMMRAAMERDKADAESPYAIKGDEDGR